MISAFLFSSALGAFAFSASAICAKRIFSISGANALKSILANNGAHFCTVMLSGIPNAVHSSKLLAFPPKAASIFSLVSGIKLSSSDAQISTVSARLYKTSFKRSFCVSSLASAQGMVSSIYLFARRRSVNISVIASAIRSASAFASTFFTVSLASFLNSLSSSVSLLSGDFTTVPPKYFSIIATVRDTRLPKTLARSVLKRSHTSSHVICPSLSNGISWSTK